MEEFRDEPYYSLDEMQEKIYQGNYEITDIAMMGALSLNIKRAEVIKIVLSLTEYDFVKSMQSIERDGLWQDVYLQYLKKVPLYIKLQIDDDSKAVIISFKDK